MYVWGIPSGRYAPELFEVDRENVPASVVLDVKGPRGDHLTATVISSAFEMADDKALIIASWYGMKSFKRIIGENIQKVDLWE